jgi:hypothetical protein
VRDKRRSELEAFRDRMRKEAQNLELSNASPEDLSGSISAAIRRLEPAFDETARALSDPLRVPKLILRQGGTYALIGVVTGLGAWLGGLVGGAVAGTIAAGTLATAAKKVVGEAIKKPLGALGEEAASLLCGTKINTSLSYLFYAKEAVRSATSNRSR